MRRYFESNRDIFASKSAAVAHDIEERSHLQLLPFPGPQMCLMAFVATSSWKAAVFVVELRSSGEHETYTATDSRYRLIPRGSPKNFDSWTTRYGVRNVMGQLPGKSKVLYPSLSPGSLNMPDARDPARHEMAGTTLGQ